MTTKNASAGSEPAVQTAAQPRGILGWLAHLRGATKGENTDHQSRSFVVHPKETPLEAYTQAVFESVEAPVIVLDPRGRCLRANPVCVRVMGIPLQEMLGRGFWELISTPAEQNRIQHEFTNLIHRSEPFTFETSFIGADGRKYWLSWSFNLVIGEGNVTACLVGTGVDQTDRKQRERQQEAFTALASGLRGEPAVAVTYELIFEYLRRFLGADLVAAALRQPGGEFIFEKTFGADAAAVAGKPLRIDGGGPAQAIAGMRPCLRPASADELPYLPPEAASAYRSTVWAPLLVGEEPAAVLLAASKDLVCPQDLEGVAAAADMAASAINRRILFDETQRRLRRLTALSTINIAISSSLDIQVTLRILVNQITAQLGVHAADILLVDPVTRDLHCAAHHGFRSGDVDRTHLWMGQGYAGQVAMQHKSIHLFEPGGIGELFLPERRLHSDEFVAYHAVPLTIKGEVKGVLETFQRQPYQPDPEWPQFLETLAAETSIALNNADLLDKLQRNNLALAVAYDATIEGWALALEMRDRQTEDHTRRVTEQTLRLAQAIGIRGDDLKYIRYGALLHDIGKIGIPDSILNKTGPLNDQEWEKMRRHPEYSRQMLESISFLGPAMVIPYSHHERWDGSGYPQKLSGLQIPLPARIFAVVDVWDALSYGRVYREALPEEEVLHYLQSEAGRLFDPDVVAAFIELRRLSTASEGAPAG